MRKLLFLISLFLFTFQSFSQIGKDCSNPWVINSLPFSATGLTTQGYANDYSVPCPSCGSTTFMSGEDFVFKLIPAVDMNLSVRLNNTTSPAAGVGLFLVKGCPDDPQAQLIGMAEGASSGYPKILSVPVLKDSVYFIIIDTYNFININPNTGFSIEVFEAFQVDFGGLSIFEPRTACNLTDTERFVFTYKNYGLDTLSNITMGYKVNNNPEVLEIQPNPVIPNNTFYFTFTTRSDLSSPNTTYDIKMFVKCPGDQNPMNDTIFFRISNHESINSFPYFEDFEANDGGWSAEWINQMEPGTSWQHGSPAKSIINGAASGSKCWVTDTLGTNLFNESSYVIGPCFDFTSLTMPVLEMDIWYETQSADIIIVEYTTDNTPGQNVNWNRLGNSGEGLNWYNYTYQTNSAWNGSSGGWLHAIHTLDPLVGEPFVKFRVTFRGGLNGLADGFAFDNFKISESPMADLTVSEIIYPENSCSLSSADSVTILIKNQGLNPVSEIVVVCSIDGGVTFVTDTIHTTLNFSDTLIYTFIPTFDFATPGIYNIVTAVVLAGDQYPTNDTSFKEIMSYPVINSVPYIEDFENNNGHWYTSGLNNSWEWGIPSDSVLTNAFSGQKCWATNLSGYHNLAERSYVESPCFDLSQYKNPKIKLAVWYDEIYPTYFQMDTISFSTDWYYLGSATDPDWYNVGHAWNNSSNGWQEVSYDIKMFTEIPHVKFRFHFEGAIQKSGFAFDHFTVCDKPVADFSEDLSIKGYFVTFINSSSNMDSCLWDFGDGTFSNLITPPDHTYPNSDSVLVTLYVYNSCGVDSIKKYVHPKFVGVFSPDLDNNVSIFPNPARDNVQVNLIDFAEEVNIEILNMQGKSIMFEQFAAIGSNPIVLSLNQLTSGIYIIKIITEKGTVYRKLIKN